MDLSASQLAHAMTRPKVSYHQGSVPPPLALSGSLLGLRHGRPSGPLVGLAQFYQEFQRTLIPGGVLAIWCYGLVDFPHRHEKLEGLVRLL